MSRGLFWKKLIIDSCCPIYEANNRKAVRKQTKWPGRDVALKVVFRADASRVIGAGHVMRCLSLADELRVRGASIQFICRDLEGHLADHIEQNGFAVSLLVRRESDSRQLNRDDHTSWLGVSWQVDADETLANLAAQKLRPDWLVVDNYALDKRWEEQCAGAVSSILVIDDLADRAHSCDLLLDQNFYTDSQLRYQDSLPDDCRQLLGPRFALLRSDFAKARLALRHRNGIVRKILVLFGGSDNGNLTGVAIAALHELALPDVEVNVVVGGNHQSKDSLRAACLAYGYRFHGQTTCVAELMSDADLAIGAGGGTLWERCCLGLPCLTFAVARNQERQVAEAASTGVIFAPDVDPADQSALVRHMNTYIENPKLLKAMSRRQLSLVDPRGCARVARAMGILTLSIREAAGEDSENVFAWRNDESVRKVSLDARRIGKSAHVKWFKEVLADSNRMLLIGELNGEPVGVVRFDITSDQARISIYMVPGKDRQGFGSELILAAESWLASSRKDVLQISAEVLGRNSRSQELFTASGYTFSTNMYVKRIR